jgi:hypothetical protein
VLRLADNVFIFWFLGTKNLPAEYLESIRRLCGDKHRHKSKYRQDKKPPSRRPQTPTPARPKVPWQIENEQPVNVPYARK